MINSVLVIVALQIAVLAGADVLHRLNISVLTTRKCAHMAAGLLAVGLPFFVEREAALLCGIVGTVLMGVAIWYGYLPAIGSRGTFDFGAAAFPLGLTVSAFLFWHPDSFTSYQYAALMLALPDAVAGWAGVRYATYTVHTPSGKTLMGSLAFFTTALFMSALFLHVMQDQGILLACLRAGMAAIILTFVEALSTRGSDNVSVPLSAGAIASMFF